MMLTVTNTSAADPLDWTFSFVRGYALPSGFADILAFEPGRPFRDFADQRFALETLVAGRQRAILQARPEIEPVDARLLHARIVGDRIVLPDRKTGGHAAWCASLVRVRCILPIAPTVPDLDATSLVILQLLREGFTAREIGGQIGLSFRTVEHKLEKLKAAFGARSVAHLAILSVTAAMGQG
ncbi:MAG TPA: LuxR C-terminal-related transcriptional regulator [Shinella sp.]|uniref:helix-turn-helix transcriptional regulator n=1 Tax=Shinella sp. TaxID=1870904 RepID=UPI002E11EC07|nr:LuxR C-terminal-related transcriptional regulator [Shinella sp.]